MAQVGSDLSGKGAENRAGGEGREEQGRRMPEVPDVSSRMTPSANSGLNEAASGNLMSGPDGGSEASSESESGDGSQSDSESVPQPGRSTAGAEGAEKGSGPPASTERSVPSPNAGDQSAGGSAADDSGGKGSGARSTDQRRTSSGDDATRRAHAAKVAGDQLFSGAEGHRSDGDRTGGSDPPPRAETGQENTSSRDYDQETDSGGGSRERPSLYASIEPQDDSGGDVADQGRVAPSTSTHQGTSGHQGQGHGSTHVPPPPLSSQSKSKPGPSLKDKIPRWLEALRSSVAPKGRFLPRAGGHRLSDGKGDMRPLEKWNEDFEQMRTRMASDWNRQVITRYRARAAEQHRLAGG